MRRYLILLFLVSAAWACRESDSTDKPALAVRINAEGTKLILDVRTPEEFAEGHIEGATLINFQDDNFQEQTDKLDKNIPVYVYCASGVRSDKAASILNKQGFKEVYVLEGGLKEWTSQNKTIVK
jgi:rhodanese-related sulfurtransferase